MERRLQNPSASSQTSLDLMKFWCEGWPQSRGHNVLLSKEGWPASPRSTPRRCVEAFCFTYVALLNNYNLWGSATSMRSWPCSFRHKTFLNGMTLSKRLASPLRILHGGLSTSQWIPTLARESKTFYVWMPQRFKQWCHQPPDEFQQISRTSAPEQLSWCSMMAAEWLRWRTSLRSGFQSRGFQNRSDWPSLPMDFEEALKSHKQPKAEPQQWCQTCPLTSTILDYLLKFHRKFGLRWPGFTSILDILHDKNFADCWPMKAICLMQCMSVLRSFDVPLARDWSRSKHLAPLDSLLWSLASFAMSFRWTSSTAGPWTLRHSSS